MEKSDKNSTWGSLKDCIAGHIETKEKAEKMIKDVAYGFYFIAAFQVVLSFFLHQNFFIDALIILSLAKILTTNKSRTSAVMLFLYSIGAMIVTFNNRITHGNGGQNIYLSLLVSVYAFASMRAAFSYHKFIMSKIQWNNILKLQIYALVLSIFAFILAVVIFIFIPIGDDEFKGSIYIAIIILIYFLTFLRKLPFTDKWETITIN